MSNYVGQSAFIEVLKVDVDTTPLYESNIILGKSLWQNPINRFDVNGDGVVDQSDYVALDQYIRMYGAGKLPKARPENELYVDVNGDGYVTTKDLTQLATYLAYHITRDNSDRKPHHVRRLVVHREIVHPLQVNTVKDAASRAGVHPISSYRAFFRDYSTQSFSETSLSAFVRTKDSIVYINKALFDCPECGPHFGAPGCDTEPCVFKLLRAQLRCKVKCMPNGTPVWSNNCLRSEILPARYLHTAKPIQCIPDPPTPVPEVPPPKLARTAIICIYDEADEYYVGSYTGYASEYVYPGTPQERYEADKQEWEAIIAKVASNPRVKLRLGLLQPYIYNAATKKPWGVICDGCALPRDSDRASINYRLLSGPDSPSMSNTKRTPRVSTDEIVDMFNQVTGNGGWDPTFLLFVLDNSGSVYVSDYQAQLTAAKAIIKSKLPKIEILDDKTTARPERWIRGCVESISNLIKVYG